MSNATGLTLEKWKEEQESLKNREIRKRTINLYSYHMVFHGCGYVYNQDWDEKTWDAYTEAWNAMANYFHLKVVDQYDDDWDTDLVIVFEGLIKSKLEDLKAWDENPTIMFTSFSRFIKPFFDKAHYAEAREEKKDDD